ncbi:hypothetical protein BWI17_06735 [Betaproteobacteria bacterium GR16-43]|nr:hypothetical protein BWI17_06735 [Betaproteobacteria bacterium GR16-43]
MSLPERTGSHAPRATAPHRLPAREKRPAGAIATGFAALALLCAAVGCATTPTTGAVFSAANASEPVQIQNSRGTTLSTAQSKRILDDLTARSPNADLLERHLAIEEAVNAKPLTSGNKAVLLQDGPATYAAMFREMEAAREHIYVEMYIVEDDETGRQFADLWLRKQKQGVPVSLLYDAVGCIDTPKEFFQRLRDGGITVAQFNPVNPLEAKKGWDLNQRDHRKLLIVDGRVAFVGGINISGVYSGGSSTLRKKSDDTGKTQRPWRDTQVQVEGPVVAQLQQSYLESWSKAEKNIPPTKQKQLTPKSAGKELVRPIEGWADRTEKLNPIYATFLSAITNSEKSVHIAMAYFVPDPQMMGALEAAAKRGVDVQLILPSFTDSWVVFHAARSKYADLLEAGVKIHERKDRLLHAKTAVVDGVWSTVGSANLDWRSFLHNNELNVVVLGPEFADQMEAAFKRDIANSNEITREAWSRRGVKDRALEASALVVQYWL